MPAAIRPAVVFGAGKQFIKSNLGKVTSTRTERPGIKRLGRNHYFVQVSRMDPRENKRKFKRRWVRGPYAEAVTVRERALAELEAEIAGGLTPGATLGDYVERWLAARDAKLKPSTKAKYLNDFREAHLAEAGTHDDRRDPGRETSS